MLGTWSKLYRVFARCSSLVVTAEENICCEELCVKMSPALDKMDLRVMSEVQRWSDFTTSTFPGNSVSKWELI